MLSREIKEIDHFIDNRLYAFPYDGNMKEMLTEEETIAIENFAENLRKIFKYINQNLDKEERIENNFTTQNIKKQFDSIMMAFYGERFFEILNELYCKSSYHGQQLIDEFHFHKRTQYSQDVSNSEQYKKELKDIMVKIKRKNESKKR